MARYLENYIIQDLKKKMVFIAGPRQTGKTTLAKSILKNSKEEGRYFLWDDEDDKQIILNKGWSDEHRLLLFDEIHKFPNWKNYLKGIFDKKKELHQILVTGSARLDVYRQGGDSLLGRYHLWHLHPFTIDEYPERIQPEDAFNRLMNSGGFPEPFLDNDPTSAKRWRRERLQKLMREDVRDLESIRDILNLELFVKLLRNRVGGLVVLSNLATDLQISPATAKHWLQVIERLYIVFSVYPFTTNIARAIQKPPKVFFYDNGDIQGDEGARFENLVATHLFKRIEFLQDSTGDDYELRYLRDKEGREVDFVIVKNGVAIELFEAKFSETTISSSLVYWSEKLKIPGVQLISKRGFRHKKGMNLVVDFIDYFLQAPVW